MDNNTRNKIYRALSQYVDWGLPIIPLCPPDHNGMSQKHISTCRCAGKIPLIKGWQYHAETTPDHIKEWLSSWPDINIGLPMGDASGYVGIDIDGEYGESEYTKMCMGEDVDTWEYETGAGRRLIFSIPVGLKTKKFNNKSDDGGHNECAILCTGQQTVLPPSIHKSGKAYEWKPGHSPDCMDCAAAPPWLLKLIKADAPKPIGPKLSYTPAPLNTEIDPSDTFAVRTAFSAPAVEGVSSDLPVDLDDVPIKVKQNDRQNFDINVTEDELNAMIPDGQRDITMARIIGSFCAKNRNLGKEIITSLALQHNQTHCIPPLDEESIITKVNHFWELEQIKTSKFKEAAENRNSFEPDKLAQVVLNIWEESGKLFRIDKNTDRIWMCTKTQGPWRSFSPKESKFFAQFSNIISDPKYGGSGAFTTMNRLQDVAGQIIIQLRSLGLIWDTDIQLKDTRTLDNCKFIPLANGQLLDWRKGELHPWNPLSYFTYEIPREYDPHATCPYWEARLKEWIPDKSTRDLLQEYIGYSLIPYMGFEKALLIVGGGANGKSIFMETILDVLGNEVTSSNDMGTIFSHFGKINLIGKILNVCNEAGMDYLKGSEADAFKNLVSGGTVVADVKNRESVSFNNTAKFIFSANHDIKTKDKSDGWMRRLIIVPFEQSFLGSTVTKHTITTALNKEHDGIFNWALDGLRRLVINEQFSTSSVVQRKVNEYQENNDMVGNFFRKCLDRFDINTVEIEGEIGKWGTPTKIIAQLFQAWCEYNESKLSKYSTTIKEYLQANGFTSTRTNKILHSHQKQTTCWLGLRIKISDIEFMEYLQDSDEQALKELAIKSLKRLDSKAM